jgi:hypothetical protein
MRRIRIPRLESLGATRDLLTFPSVSWRFLRTGTNGERN